jgi:hypothetical protein
MIWQHGYNFHFSPNMSGLEVGNYLENTCDGAGAPAKLKADMSTNMHINGGSDISCEMFLYI